MAAMTSPGKLVLIIGPSGVGKSVILQKLRERHPEFVFPRSATTRARRQGEGADLYRFLSDEEFDDLLSKDCLLEWAQVHGGARYGTLKEEILPAIEAGKTVIREVDVQGFESIRTSSLFSGQQPPYRLISIFILPEHRGQLIARITTRAPISDEELQARIESMDKELAFAPLCTTQILNREGKIEETLAEAEKALIA
jgi:guanylate kinase